MFEYTRKIHYYETDKMGITHHSNYIRIMEEARTAFMDEMVCSYAKLENEGIISPVVSISCQYKNTTTFDDDINVIVSMEEYTGVMMKFKYLMKNTKTGEIAFIGESKHCFLDEKRYPIIIKKRYPELDIKFKQLTSAK